MKNFLNNLIQKGVALLPTQIQDLATAEGGIERYTKNTSWMFLAKAITMPVSFLVLAVVARYLGPEQYGLLSYALSFSSLFGFIASLGIEQVLYRELIKEEKSKEELLGSAFLLRFLGGCVAFILTISVSFLIEGNPLARLLILITSSVFLFEPIKVLNTYFKSQVLSKYVGLTLIGTFLPLSGIKVLLVLSGSGIIPFAVISVLEMFIYAIWYIHFYKKLGFSIFSWETSRSTMKDLLRVSWPLFLSGAFVTLFSRIDQVLLKQMVDEKAVGLYGVAAQIGEVWYIIPGLITGSLFPAIVNSRSTNNDMYFARLGKLLLFVGGIALFAALFITILAQPIISILFGSEYEGAIQILQIYVWAGAGIATWRVLEQYLITENFTTLVFLSTLAGLTINILLNILLIPHFGVNGAALATLISYLSVPVMLLIFPKTRADIVRIIKNIY